MSKTAITIVTAIVVAIVTIILQRSFSNIISGINLALRKPFKKGDRIAQAILHEYKTMGLDLVKNRERTGGFGSTGVQ